MQRRGPQRSVDVIVSAVFMITILLLSFVSLELIKVSIFHISFCDFSYFFGNTNRFISGSRKLTLAIQRRSIILEFISWDIYIAIYDTRNKN